jgi:hypothetical protein
MNYIANISRNEGDPKILRSGPSSLGSSDRLARNLGWFSIGLGLCELFAPHKITGALGMKGQESLVRAYGAREIGAGMLCLAAEKNAGLWSRVAGDMIDVATLISAMREDNPKKDNVALALAAVAGITLLDIAAAEATTVRHKPSAGNRQEYRDRSGFPKGLQASRGAASEFQAPRSTAALRARSSADLKAA